jgi:flagellar basal body-associated protein FliL
MSDEILEEEETDEPDDKPKSSPLPLIVALLAFAAGVAGIVMNVTSKPDLTPLESRIQALETSVQTNADNVATVMEEQSKAEEMVEKIVDQKLMEQQEAEAAMAEEEETTEE